MAKGILFGVIYESTAVFDERLKVKGTRKRIARKGKEWFVLDQNFRVIAIAKNKDDIRLLVMGGGDFTLESIMGSNHGRCSTQKSKEIYRFIKDINPSMGDLRRRAYKIAKEVAIRAVAGTRIKFTSRPSLYAGGIGMLVSICSDVTTAQQKTFFSKLGKAFIKKGDALLELEEYRNITGDSFFVEDNDDY